MFHELNNDARFLQKIVFSEREGFAAMLSPSRLISPLTIIPIRTKKRMYKPPYLANKLSVDEMMKKARAAGIITPQEDLERPINVSCTAGILDAYVPPEGDARLSTLSKDGLKQRTEQLKQTAASQLAIRKIKNYDEDFSTKVFPEKAQEIFIEAHNCLTQLLDFLLDVIPIFRSYRFFNG
ncbi:unnamed protein product [Ranitomeya imitator]|uniref:Uncharacterized protein n=1 Tax=Ranitomeya imitator TaxID=111125 RepID=A0ABN9LVC1_9NEOB|nr:unnamed protein product [Ranitomeya imitator]